MSRNHFIVTLFILFGCACGDSEDAPDASSTADAGAAAPDMGVADMGEANRDSVRGVRTCELNELFIDGDTLSMRVWNEVQLHDCPDTWLARSTRISTQWEDRDGGRSTWYAPSTARPLWAPLRRFPRGWATKWLTPPPWSSSPLSDLERQLGVTIETLEDIPAQARRNLLDTTLFGTSYVPRRSSAPSPQSSFTTPASGCSSSTTAAANTR